MVQDTITVIYCTRMYASDVVRLKHRKQEIKENNVFIESALGEFNVYSYCSKVNPLSSTSNRGLINREIGVAKGLIQDIRIIALTWHSDYCNSIFLFLDLSFPLFAPHLVTCVNAFLYNKWLYSVLYQASKFVA